MGAHTHTHTHKDRNSADLTEAEDIKKRGQEYRKPYKKDLKDSDTMMVWALT